jgi:hypothetical protein
MHVLRIDMVRFNVDVAAGDEGLLGPPGYWGSRGKREGTLLMCNGYLALERRSH